MNFLEIVKTLNNKIPVYGLKEEHKKAILEYYNSLIENEQLMNLLDEYNKRIFEEKTISLSEIENLKENDGKESGMLFVILYLARYEIVCKFLRDNNYPSFCEVQLMNKLRDLMDENFDFYDAYGLNGIYRPRYVHYLNLRIINIGRLIFEMCPFAGPYSVYKNKIDNSYITIAVPGFKYGKDGLRVLDTYEGETFEATFKEENSNVYGYTFNEDGALEFEPIVISLNEYEKVLDTGDKVLSVHIPRGGKLTQESVDEAFSEAENFYKKYFPDYNYIAYICSSWMLDLNLKKFLKPESNILKFQNNFNIVMGSINYYSIYWHVFNVQKFLPLEQLEPTNSLQKNLLDWIKDGGTLHNGYGFIMR